MSLRDALGAAQSAVAAARVRPQSRRKAMLAALVIDAAVDQLFEATGADDPLAFGAALRARAPALGPILDLAAMHAVQLVIEPVEVTLADYPALPVGDYMVSLYNDRTVPRVRIAAPDGSRLDAHEALAAALAALEAEAARI